MAGLDEARRLERTRRLPDRRLTDAELPRELALGGQTGPGLELTAEDLVAEGADDLVGQLEPGGQTPRRGWGRCYATPASAASSWSMRSRPARCLPNQRLACVAATFVSGRSE